MYQLNPKTKKLTTIERCSFKSLNLKERSDLQEWIANEPRTLGEDLLIIQKEFDGWDGTKERLDLLALDKNGNLVIIENKLDDSGKDVIWQALKYASYCSSLSTEDIIRIYQEYLGPSQNAMENISDFFYGKDIADIELNKGNSQRIFLVAAKFKQEVTSTALYLRNFGIRLSCFTVSIYKFGEQILLEFDQIIPTKEAEDYQIKIASKNQSEDKNAESASIRYENRKRFWLEYIEYCKTHNGLYSNSSGTTDNWMSKSVPSIAGSGIEVVITKDVCRCQLYMNAGTQDANKHIFDTLYAHKEEIEKSIGECIWQRLDDKVTCRIKIERPWSYLNELEKLDIFKFFTTCSQKMLDTFTEYGKKLHLSKK